MIPVLAQVAFTIEVGLLLLSLSILIGPVVAERIRIPGLVGLIFMGMLLGPFVLQWLLPGGLVATVGAAGLLYLMFLAGLELDLKTFSANRAAAITFGLLTFVIPFALSFLVGSLYLDYSLAGSALVGAMWASHTIVAYPEVKTAGLDANRAVGSAVASTVITDVIALVVLAIAVSRSGGHTAAGGHVSGLVPLWLGVVLLAGFTLWVLPRLTKLIFVRVGHTRTQRFVAVLIGMSAGATVALVGGIEGLVGAFLAGIGINRLVPAKGELMEHVEFFGSALFVPAFLVSVGLSIDPGALVEPSTLRLALIFSGLVVVGKAMAAVVSGRIFHFSWPEIGVLATLTMGQAAATLAVAQVGLESGILDQQVLNAAVLTVVITVLVTSLGTRFTARRIEEPEAERLEIGAHVLVHAPPVGTESGLIAFATAVAGGDGGLVTPFVVAHPDDQSQAGDRLDDAVEEAVRLGHDSEGVTRVDTSFRSGATGLAYERKASVLIMGWDGPRYPGDFVFGNWVDEVGATSSVPVAAAHVSDPEWARVVVIAPRPSSMPAWREDLDLALAAGRAAAEERDVELVVFAPNPDVYADSEATVRGYRPGDGSVLAEIVTGDLVIVPVQLLDAARDIGLRRLARAFQGKSLVVVAGPERLRVGGRGPRRSALGAVGGRSVRGPWA